MLDSKFIQLRKADLLKSRLRMEKELEKFTKTKDKGRQTIFPEIGNKEDETAQEVEMYESSLSIEKNLEERLKEINAALKRIENGTYGQCLKCNGQIPRKRLEAYAEAKICLQCSKK